MAHDKALQTADSKLARMHPDDQEMLLKHLLAQASENPLSVAFPPMLPVELAMKVDTPKNICAAFNLTRDDFARIIAHPVFIKAYQEAIEMLKVDGMSFKTKSKMLAEDYLTTAHNMVKNPNTTDAVRADLIKNTVRWAGYDAKAVDTAAAGSAFNIQINLG
jgi:hypothetical protein